MILSITGIGLGILAIILVYRSKKDQEMTNDLVDSDTRQNGNALLALQQEFTQYQVDSERKISELEKQLEIKSNKAERRMDKMNKALPSVIRTVIGHIEFAKPLNKK